MEVIVLAQEIGASDLNAYRNRAMCLINPYWVPLEARNDKENPDGGERPEFLKQGFVPAPPTKPKAKLKIVK